MPYAPMKPCRHPGCPALTKDGWCDKHRPKRDYKRENKDRVRCKLYDTARWKRFRLIKLKRNPLCEECLEHGRVVQAKHVDHKEPHRGDTTLFFDIDNLRSLCMSCHSRKTAKEDGGFGNKRA